MLLADCAMGSLVTLNSADFDSATCFRLRELGLGCGVCAILVQRAPFGGRVLAVGGQRIAIDGRTARRIEVETRASSTAATLARGGQAAAAGAAA